MVKNSLLLFGIFIHVFSYIILFKKIEPFYIHFYPFVWWSYIIIMDAVYAIKFNKHLIIKKTLPYMVIISAGFWCIFELINVRIENWFYINLPQDTFQRYLGYLISYGTVIPAIYITKDFIHNILGDLYIKRIKTRKYHIYAISSGLIMLFLTLFIPEFFFGLAWVSIGLIFEGYYYKVGDKSFFRDLEQGYLGNIISSMISGFLCGILWELWNYWAITKWVYTVPFFENLKIFEMPLAGYVGFIVFGLETISFLNFLETIWSQRIKLIILTIIMACLSIFTFGLIDRYTVFSYIATIDDIDFIDKQKIESFKNKGIKTSYKIELNVLDRNEKDLIDLMHLKGLGIKNLKKLRQNNINSINKLSTFNENALSMILQESNIRRLKVFLKAAKKKNAPKKGRFNV